MLIPRSNSREVTRPRDESGLVSSDDRNFGQFAGHATITSRGSSGCIHPIQNAEGLPLSLRAGPVTYTIDRYISTNMDIKGIPKRFYTRPALPDMTAYTATVTVRLKRGVLDPEAETTQQALERLGFELSDLRSADRFEVDLDAADADEAADRADEMAERLLANPTIHDYEVAVAER